MSEILFWGSRLFELGVTSQGDSLVEAQKNLNEARRSSFISRVSGHENLPDISGASYWTGY
jgi:predicted RNase H-like HicB family nuclease